MGNANPWRKLKVRSEGENRSVPNLEGAIAPRTQSAVAQLPARWRHANIVRTRHESQTIYYSIDDSDVLRILRLLGHIYTDDPVMQRTRH